MHTVLHCIITHIDVWYSFIPFQIGLFLNKTLIYDHCYKMQEKMVKKLFTFNKIYLYAVHCPSKQIPGNNNISS